MEDEREEKEDKELAVTDDEELVPEDENIQERFKRLKRDLERCRKEKEEYLAGWQRSRADFINYQRAREAETESTANSREQKVLKELLIIMDHFEQAFASGPPNLLWVSGISQIRDACRDILNRYGVEPIEVVGKTFDPKFYEAVEMVGTQKESEDGMVVEEVQKGYTRGEEIIRPAKVKVAHFEK